MTDDDKSQTEYSDYGDDGDYDDFRMTLHAILTLLVNWAASNIASWNDLSQDEQAMTKSAESLLARCNIDFVATLFLVAIPLPVQTLFAAPFSLEEILSLPRVGAGGIRRGIYGNFPTGSLIHANDVGCETYVG